MPELVSCIPSCDVGSCGAGSCPVFSSSSLNKRTSAWANETLSDSPLSSLHKRVFTYDVTSNEWVKQRKPTRPELDVYLPAVWHDKLRYFGDVLHVVEGKLPFHEDLLIPGLTSSYFSQKTRIGPLASKKSLGISLFRSWRRVSGDAQWYVSGPVPPLM